MTPFYRRPITLRSVAIALAIPLLGVGVPLLGWQLWNARPLDVTREFNVSMPAVPSPNAHDLYRQAHDKFSDNLNRRDLPSAALDYRDTPPDKLYPLAAKVRWVEANRRAFELFERGLQAEYLFPPVRSEQPDGRIESPFELSWLARYLTVEVEALAEQKQHAAAANRALDIWQMSIQASHGAPSFLALRAMLAEGQARRALDGEIAYLNGTQALKLAKRLEKLAATRATYRQALREHRDAELFQWKAGVAKRIYDEQREREFAARLEREETTTFLETGPAPKLKGPIIDWQVRRMSREFARGMDALLANADSPWSKRATILPADIDPKMARLLAKLDESRFFHAKADAFAQLTLARLALHAYRKDNGIYPPTLAQLAPKYLNKTPIDAFADGAPLHYRRSGKRYQLWSIGPDATDDDARPMQNPRARTDENKNLVTREADGDIVANISS